ncbi:MAG TPA: translocation/assembly module TamB domain-containing protein, partial [Elusimicrobiota bacterium]|nr:translocation/assembly module TamB domain-containing protein [Elusimicrobiota bacterium]
ISVDLPSVEVAGPSGTTLGAARLAFDRASAAPLTLDARWRSRAAGRVQGGSARVAVASDFLKTGQLTRLDATGKVRADGESAEFSVKARQAGADAVALEARASGESASARFRFSGKGRQTPRSNELAGELAVAASTGPVKSLRLDPIRFELDRGKGGAWSALRVEAGLRAEPVGLRTVRGFTPPRFIVGRATLNVRAAPMAFQPDHFDADLSILLNPYMSWYEAHADLYVRAAGRLGALSKARIQERLDASASVARFKDLVAFLAGTPYAVPAPLDALEGGLRASFSARGEPGSDRVEFDYGARADLSGGKQRLKLHVSGSGGAARAWTPERSVETRGTVTLDDVAVQLPDLDPLKMPKATLDSRIKDTSARAARRSAAREPEEGAAASTASFVAMRLNVVTARPVILYSNLALSPVPITLDLALAKPPGSATGNVSVGTFDAEFFRRRATVEHVDLSFRPDSKLVALDGLVNYKAAEALIHIKLLGTVEKPQVVFESDPPLSQSDIVSMLVFGKSPDELDADQASTVANSQTAMTDEAFGLASLYLFASTPIQFVGYDPATKSYSLKFRLPGGETLSLNSDFESTNSVQLRKRLSRHFAIEAEAVNSQTEGNGVVTFLEWFTRY